MNKNDIFYGLLTYEQLMPSVEDVINEVFDLGEIFEPGKELDELMDGAQWPIRVLKFRRMDITRFVSILAEKCAEYALEMLDEEHSDPDGDPTEPSQDVWCIYHDCRVRIACINKSLT